MKLFKWSKGRQAATENIQKMTLWIGNTFDVYLLKIPAETYVDEHVDEVDGKEHHRFNLNLYGKYVFYRYGNHIRLNILHFMNWVKFRPDIEPHSAYFCKNTLILSIGWVK